MFDEIRAEGEEVLTDWAPAMAGLGMCVGRILRCGPSGPVFVECEGSEPKEARLVAGLKRDELIRAVENQDEVLIVFERGDSDRPIIVALMEQADGKPPDTKSKAEPLHAEVDGETVNIQAQKQIVLKCGKASITLTRAGKVLIRGAYVLNRSSGVNRIKGGSVQIN